MKIMNATVAPLLQTIVHWPHAYEGEAHCLARIYHLSAQQVLVVLSAIRSNSTWLGLTLDFPGAANAIQPKIESLGISSSPADILWMAHHGKFSSYDAPDQEEFSQVNLRWVNNTWAGDLTNWYRLSPAIVNQLQQEINLVPVPEVLPAIDWTQA